MKSTFRFLFLAVVFTPAALAVARAPEIDPASAGSALALIAGVTVLIRGRRKQS